ncbi:hypothetical protein KJ632_02705 [Patescibacteria group bacterium]|nr:hypothetical protein [Patescibacteria group bacterium]
MNKEKLNSSQEPKLSSEEMELTKSYLAKRKAILDASRKGFYEVSRENAED